MGIEEVHPQEEGAVLVVLLQPAHDVAAGPRWEGLVLAVHIAVGPAVDVHQVAILEVVARARLLPGHHLLDRIVHPQEGDIALLPANLVRGVEDPVEAGVEEVGAVADQLRDIAVLVAAWSA